VATLRINTTGRQTSPAFVRVETILLHAGLILCGLLVAVPFIYMITGSLKTNGIFLSSTASRPTRTITGDCSAATDPCR
jgi:ABC-type glycerol-3-phosphate transport system permease component